MTAAVSTPQTPATMAQPAAEATPAAAAEPSLEDQTAALIAAATEGASEDGAAPATEEAAPAADKLSLAGETLKKARKVAAARREAVARAEREKLRADQFAERFAQGQKELATEREEREALKDPKKALDVLRKAGIKARDLAQVAIDEGTPEARMAALEAKHAADLAAVRAESRAEFEAMLKARDEAAHQAASRNAFFGMISPDTHPQLSRLDQDVVLTIAHKEFVKAKANGHNPTDKQVLDWCENLLSSPQSGAGGSSTPKTNLQGTTVAKPVAKPSPASRTVTADLAGRRYTAPADIENMSLSDQQAALVKMLEDAERAGS